MLEQYLKDIKAEAKDVEERITELRNEQTWLTPDQGDFYYLRNF